MKDNPKGAEPGGAPRRDAVLSTLGLCKKAGKLVMGFDVVAEAAASGSIPWVMTAQDLSPKSRKEIVLVAQKHHIAVHTAPVTMDELWYMVGKRAGILGVTDPGLAQLLMGKIDGLSPAHCVNEEE